MQLLQAHGSQVITLGVIDKHLTQSLFDLVPNAITLRLHLESAEPEARSIFYYCSSRAAECNPRPFAHLQHVSLQRIIVLWDLYEMSSTLSGDRITESAPLKIKIILVQGAGKVAAHGGGGWKPSSAA